MPSEDYNRLTDADLAALVAYVRQLPPATGAGAAVAPAAAGAALYGVGVVHDAAEKIDHALPPAQPVRRRRDARARRVRRQRLHRLPRREAGRRQDPRRAARLAGRGQAHAGRRQRDATRYADAEQFMAMLKTGKRPDGSASAR